VPPREPAASGALPILGELREILTRRPGIAGPVCRNLPKYDNSMNNALRHAFARAGVPKAPPGYNGWHRLRHTAASLLTKHGADYGIVGLAMGHQQGSPITGRYITPDDEKLCEVMERVSQAVRTASTWSPRALKWTRAYCPRLARVSGDRCFKRSNPMREITSGLRSSSLFLTESDSLLNPKIDRRQGLAPRPRTKSDLS
jgi:hypothetical protein